MVSEHCGYFGTYKFGHFGTRRIQLILYSSVSDEILLSPTDKVILNIK